MLGRLGLLPLAVALSEVVLGSGGQPALLASGLLDGAVGLAVRRRHPWFSVLAGMRGLAALVHVTSVHPERIPATLLAHAPGLFAVWCVAVARALDAQRAAGAVPAPAPRARPPAPRPASQVLDSPALAAPPVQRLAPARRSGPKWRVGTTPIATPPEATSPSALRRLLSERPTAIFLRARWRAKLTPTEDVFPREETPTDLDP